MMNNLKIDKTKHTPQVMLNTLGDFTIKGVSTPENAQKFFQPIINWLNEFKLTNPSHINFVMEIEYLNTSSSRIVVDLLRLLNQFKLAGTTVSITWTYEAGDEDMLELGEDLQTSSKSEIIFLAI